MLYSAAVRHTSSTRAVGNRQTPHKLQAAMRGQGEQQTQNLVVGLLGGTWKRGWPSVRISLPVATVAPPATNMPEKDLTATLHSELGGFGTTGG